MKIRTFFTVALALMIAAPQIPVTNINYVYANDISSEKSINAEDLVFNYGQTESKKLNFVYTGIDEKNIAFSYDDRGIFEIAPDGTVTPKDIGHGEVTIMDVTDESVFKKVTIYVWEDILPKAPDINISAESTIKTVTLTDNTVLPEGQRIEYSYNGFIWQTDTVFDGLQSDTEYSFYVRILAKINNKEYTIYSSEDAEVIIKTKAEDTRPQDQHFDLTPISLKEGNSYQINLTNFAGKELVFSSDDASIASVTNDGIISANKEGNTNINFYYKATDKNGYEFKYVYHNKVTVSKILNADFTITPSYDTFKINCNTLTTAEGYKAKFSFDSVNWTESTTLKRNYKNPQTTVYSVFMDDEGFYRSKIVTVNCVPGEETKTVNSSSSDSVLKGKDSVLKEEVIDDDSHITSVTSSNTAVLKVRYEDNKAVIRGISKGTAVVTIDKTTYSFNSNGKRVITKEIKKINYTVTEESADNKNSDDDKDSDGKNKNKDTSKDTDKGKGGNKSEKKLILAVPTIELEDDYYFYNGKVQTPKFTVKISKKVIKNNLYTVTYSKRRKNVGRYCITVKMKPESGYIGTKRLYYYIMPKKMTGLTLKNTANRKVKVSWKKGSPGITGYEINYATTGSFKNSKTIKVKGAATLSKTVKIPKGRYVRVRAYYYSKDSNKTIYSQWSNIKKVK
ncbi:MAG: Ig-like domain-containing protein [Eubacterium sp.]|nr:Ig-like domain-containing protein [Eubacterium sp.]